MARPRLRPTRILALVLALLLGLTGCIARRGAESAPVPSRGLAQIARTGEIRIGMSGEQPPLTMTAKSGDLLGLDVALSRVLAKSMGVDARFVQMPFAELLPALDAGALDMVMSGMTITPERSQRATFIGPYFTSGKTLLTKSERLAAVETPEDLDDPSLRLAALAGSTSEAFVRRSIPRASLVTSERLEDAILAVSSGGVDALVADRETCHFAVLRHPEAGLIASEAAFTVEPMGIAVDSDDPRFAALIESYMEALEERGILQKARDFWFRDPSWVKDLR